MGRPLLAQENRGLRMCCDLRAVVSMLLDLKEAAATHQDITTEDVFDEMERRYQLANNSEDFMNAFGERSLRDCKHVLAACLEDLVAQKLVSSSAPVNADADLSASIVLAPTRTLVYIMASLEDA